MSFVETVNNSQIILTEGAVIERLHRDPSIELDGLEQLDGSEPDKFADELLDLHLQFGIKVIGGCCGTDHNHIEAIAAQFQTSIKKST